MAVAVYTKSGNKATTTAKLDKSIFSVVPENHEVLKRAYLAYLANGRVNLARTKTRGDVRGGGRKPWRQKGLGRARFGSSRVPIWRGGGITFGPTGQENYSVKLPLSAKRLALKQALSLAAKESKLSIIEDIAIKDSKTAEAYKLLNKISPEGTSLIVVANKTPELTRPFKNLWYVKMVQPRYLNTYDVLNADNLIITSEALKDLHSWLLGESK